MTFPNKEPASSPALSGLHHADTNSKAAHPSGQKGRLRRAKTAAINDYCQSFIILLRSGTYDCYAPAVLLPTAVCV